MNSTEIAAIFVDYAMRITSFTPRARQLFNVILTDTRQSLVDIANELRYPQLIDDIGDVLDKLSVREREVEASDGCWYIARISPCQTVDDRLTGVVLTFTDITARKRARELTQPQQAEEELRRIRESLEARVEERTRELARANEALKRQITERTEAEETRLRLLRQLVRAQEDERRRMSRELHDQLGQNVTALALKLSSLKGRGDVSPEVRSLIEGIEDLVKKLDSDVEFLVWKLRPTGLDDLGLADALQDYAASWSRLFGTAAHFHSNLSGRLPAEIETVLYRIAQEALNNVAKHAKASHVEILLEQDAGGVTLTIQDNGIGFDTAAPVDPRSLGLISMRERAALVSGSLSIVSGAGTGTVVRVVVPM